jgi:BMFP domain-containing protein YqiC
MAGSKDGVRQRLDDLAGMAGGAFSVLAGLKNEAGQLAKSRADAFAQRMELVRREEFEAALEMARRAREETEVLAEKLAALEARLSRLEAGRSDAPATIMIAQTDSSTEA